MMFLKKSKTFIYQLIRNTKQTLIKYHKIILLTKESDLDKKFNRNFYDIFYDWGLEIIQYGTLISLTLTIINITWLTHILWIIPLGIIRWLIFDTIKTYKKLK